MKFFLGVDLFLDQVSLLVVTSVALCCGEARSRGRIGWGGCVVPVPSDRGQHWLGAGCAVSEWFWLCLGLGLLPNLRYIQILFLFGFLFSYVFFFRVPPTP